MASTLLLAAGITLVTTGLALQEYADAKGAAAAPQATTPTKASQQFKLGSSPLLKLDTSCNVSVKAGVAGQANVTIDADEKRLASLKVQAAGGELFISQQRGQGDAVVIEGGNISINTGGSIVINNGQVFIDGKEVKPTAPGKPCNIAVTMPEGSDLSGVMSGRSALTSAVTFNSADIYVSGSSSARIIANSMEVSLSGSSIFNGTVKGGNLQMMAAGSSAAEVIGKFNGVSASISGASRLTTSGAVTGNYKAQASGASQVIHSGGVTGNVRKTATGASTISVQ